MTRTIAIKVRLIALSIFLLNAPAYASDRHWYVKADHFECFMNNLGEYLKQEGKEIIVFLNDCPVSDLTILLSRQTLNSSISNVDRKRNSLDRPAEVILFWKNDLDCLVDRKFDQIGDIIVIPRNPCEE